MMSGETTCMCTDEEQRNVIQPTMVLQEASPQTMSDEQRNISMAIEENHPTLDRSTSLTDDENGYTPVECSSDHDTGKQ